ncbi:MAG TPA: hypothetical protein VD833_25435 [Vicinamibacterales bacterium]|nr:hypothetical protein [Vicinamibacterales bacterium]
MKIRQWLISLTVFVIVMGGLATADDRVRESLAGLVGGGTPLHHRAVEVGSALYSALRHQSIENAPMVIFAALGFVLFLFMVRS